MTDSGAAGDSNWPDLRAWVLYAILAVIPSAILWIHPGGLPLYYPAGDLAQTLWNHWWFDQAIKQGSNPYWCPILFHPFGAPLYVHTFELIDIIVTAPVRWLFGIAVAWKAALYLNTLWSSVATHALARRLGAGRLAAILAAAVFAHCSFRYVNVRAVSLLAFGHPVFLVWAIVGVVQQPGSWKRGALVGLGAVLTAFSMLYYLLFTATVLVIAGAGALAFGKWRPARNDFKKLLVSFGIAGMVALPPIGWFYYHIQKSQGYQEMVKEFALKHKVRGSAELLQFVLPVKAREVVLQQDVDVIGYSGELKEPWERTEPPLRSHSYAPPLALVVAAIAGWRIRKRQDTSSNPNHEEGSLNRVTRAALITAAIGAMLLALGPWVKIWTSVDPADVNPRLSPGEPPEWRGIYVWSPVALLQNLPLWAHVRGWSRAGLFFELAVLILLAIPAARAVHAWTRGLQARSHLAGMLPICFVILVFAEEFQGFWETIPDKPPAMLATLRDMPGEGAVRGFPDIGYWVNGMMMYEQTIHGRPLAAGYLSRDLHGYDKWLESRAWCSISKKLVYGQQPESMTAEECQEFIHSASEDKLRFILWTPGVTEEYIPFTKVQAFYEGNGLAHLLPGADERMAIFEITNDE